MKLINYCDKVIEYSFYALFLLVPLVFAGNTSELFELNKMWLTFGLTVVVGTAWATKMVVERKISIQWTPIDILLLLFFASQIISSIFSLDQHISWWGYYSRFNGGLLSTICYILLYYAFVSNLHIKQVWKTMAVSLISGLCVALWGFPSHFGADPTCLIFRGTFDTSCWTYAFQPTVRTFSTLGQPEWLAAYMAFLLPVSMAYMLKNKSKKAVSISFLALSVFFYLLEIYSSTRAGFLAFWIVDVIFWVAIFLKKFYPRKYLFRMLIITNVLFLVCSFLFNSPLGSLSRYTLPVLTQKPVAAPTPAPTQASSQASAASSDLDSITDSGAIRLLVWKGALKAWENNPLFGTGVETFAFAYYRYKSPAHNLTSEWDYLYNKAHNEYLNYLATTGILGLGTYLGFIGIFLFLTLRWYLNKPGKKNYENYVEVTKSPPTSLLVIGIIAGYISILITDFFGFSVVIINLYLFLSPAFVFILLGLLNEDQRLVFPKSQPNVQTKQNSISVNGYQWTTIVVFFGIACWMIISLIWYRQADIAYALGYNFDQIQNFQQAYPQLIQAVQMEPHEPVYEDELSINLAALSAGLYTQKDTTQAALLAKNAVALSDDVVTHHPNNVVYWKDRVRLFYTLSASDTADEATYLQQAIMAINTAKNLAPTDAKIAYNQGILYGQAGDLPQAIQMLNNTVQLKPDYIDAYVALGLFYHEAALDKNGKVVNPAMQQKAIDTYNYILKNLAPSNTDVKKSLEQWRTSQ
jgi:O-antigen ligase/tetratricopeptide (TPR) repeat protein